MEKVEPNTASRLLAVTFLFNIAPLPDPTLHAGDVGLVHANAAPGTTAVAPGTETAPVSESGLPSVSVVPCTMDAPPPVSVLFAFVETSTVLVAPEASSIGKHHTTPRPDESLGSASMAVVSGLAIIPYAV